MCNDIDLLGEPAVYYKDVIPILSAMPTTLPIICHCLKLPTFPLDTSFDDFCTPPLKNYADKMTIFDSDAILQL